MQLIGVVDYFRPSAASGWVADREALDAQFAVDILRNGRPIARVPASAFREDLLAEGLGDGKKAFWFNPMDFLVAGENRFEVVFADTTTLLHNGATVIVDDEHQPVRTRSSDLVARSKTRWEGAEPDANLTWGGPMSGDTFFDEAVRLTGTSRLAGKHVLEIGPGYGRLLRTLRQRGYGYQSYVGLDLSAARVERLTRELGDERTRFVCGDAMQDLVGSGFDLVICSATFEHLYPNFSQALTNLRRQLSPGAALCIDFKQVDPEMLYACASFEREGGAFVRVYARWELERGFARCGFDVKGISSIALGASRTGAIAQRIFVCARAAQPASEDRCAPE